MRRHGHLPRSLLQAADGVSTVVAGAGAYLLRFHGPLAAWLPVQGRTDVLPARYLAAAPAVLLLALCASALVGGYRADVMRRDGLLRPILRAALLFAVLLLSTRVLYEDVFQYSRVTLLLTSGLFVPIAWSLRTAAVTLVLRLRAAPGGRRRAAIVASAATAARLAPALEDDPFHAATIELLWPLDGDVPDWPSAVRVTSFDELVTRAGEQGIEEVLLAPPATASADLPSWLTRLENLTVDVLIVPDLGSAVLVNAHAGVIGGVPVLSARETPLQGVHAAMKRGLDLALALALLLFTSPLLAAIALLVRLTSRGPALYGQERMGLDGRPFRMLKFRTMAVDAEDGSGPVFARPGDPRVTPLGRVLRRLSLDELPQLWNVVRGEMSLVGPRPERRTFIEEFRKSLPGYMLRHSVRAGMTGWAQVNGLRGDSSLGERLRYDLEYIDRWSLLFDLEILARTSVQVLIGKNAY